MKYFFLLQFLIVSIFISSAAFAADISVIDVKRNITLANDDIVYKDFYLNAGEGSALRKNLVVTVKRKITVRESATKNIGDFETTIGQLKIIHVGNKVSVAREFKLTSRDEEPVVEQIGIMSGDRVDLAGSFIDYSKPNYKKPSAESAPTTEATKTASVSNEALGGVVESSSKAVTTENTDAKTVKPTETANPPVPPQETPQKKNEAASAANDTRVPANDPKNEPSLFDKIMPLPKTR